MIESMAEEWEKWIDKERTNIEIIEQRIEGLSSKYVDSDNFQYREFWDEANQIPELIESLIPLPPDEKDRLLETYDYLCKRIKKKQQQEWQDLRDQSKLNRETIEQKVQEAHSLAESAPEDMHILSKAQIMLKEALAMLKNGTNANSQTGNFQRTSGLLREDREDCWIKWKETNDLIHKSRQIIWDRNYNQIHPETQIAFNEANDGNPHQALEKIKKVQQLMKNASLSKIQRDELRNTLNNAWDIAIFKVNAIRDEKRQKYEEWMSRVEGQLEAMTGQFQENEGVISKLQSEVEQFKEAIQSIRSREYGDKLRDEIAKKREKIKELEVVNRQLEGKIQVLKGKIEGTSAT